MNSNVASNIFVGFTLTGFVFVAWKISKILFKVVHGIQAHFVRKSVPLTVKFGPWAVVTGATDGIGKAYAFALARRGVNVVLISRNPKKLEMVSEEIVMQHLVTVKTIVADFSKGEEVFDNIKKELSDLSIGILVNNVGRQYKYPMYVGEVEERELWDIINVNMGATIMMTRIILPQMIENKKGAIVNISSGSELQPLPFMTVYAASKAFIKSFSNALRHEYKKFGITVQHLSPMFVNTKMNDFSYRLRETSLFVPDADTYATSALNVLGILNNSAGYWAHGLQSFFTTIPPVWLRTVIGALMNQTFMNDYNKSIKNINGRCDSSLNDKSKEF
ncbi:hypothetical protein RUM43_007078 [Polyplax serrata]|uniref:Inactive hydroxysteroid dehydrogenase-like protein 1 n=1 Tax=Polyplax serrata TaxID=468196 RepID=A0AAN8S8I1_POLSC